MDGARENHADTLIGKTLHDTHRIVRLVGRGGMGAVYEATHVRLSKKRFALKVLRDRIAGDEEAYQRFRREAEIATSLGHPNIVEVFDFYETDDGRPCIVMEYLDGDSLDVVMGRRGRLTPADTVAVLRPIAEALDLTHQRGIIHRDLKPANIFLVNAPASESGRTAAKLLDFGISKIKDSNTLLTRQNDIIGTPYYMSPEQGRGDVHDVDHTTDIFALAIIAYQALSGRLPFRSSTPLGVIFQICHEQPPSLVKLVPGLPVEVDRVMARALAKKPGQRYPRATTFIKALERAVAGQGVTGDLPELADAEARPMPTQVLSDDAADEPLPDSLAAPQPLDSGVGAVSGHGATPPGSGRLSASGADPVGGSRLTPAPSVGRERAYPLERTLKLAGKPHADGDASTDHDAPVSDPSHPTAPDPRVPGHRDAGRRRWVGAALLVSALVAAGSVAWWWVARSPRRAAAVPDASVVSGRAVDASGPAPAAATARTDLRLSEASATVTVTLELWPEHAAFRLDGQPCTDNPLVLDRSDQEHRLEVTAPGHRPTTRAVKADRDRTVRVKLPRLHGRADRVQVKPPPATNSSPKQARPDSGAGAGGGKVDQGKTYGFESL